MENKSQTQHRETQNSYATFSTHCNDIVIFKKERNTISFFHKNAGHPMRYNICYSRTSTSWAGIEMRKAKKWFHTPNQMYDVKCVMFINVETARTKILSRWAGTFENWRQTEIRLQEGMKRRIEEIDHFLHTCLFHFQYTLLLVNGFVCIA